MYFYQHGKLYIATGDKLVGVNISPDETLIIDGTEMDMDADCDVLTLHEVICKFQLSSENHYSFPVVKEVVKIEQPVEEVKNVTVVNSKSPTRKSTRS